MIDLREEPRADFFFGQQTVKDAVVIGQIVVFVSVSKDCCVEIEKRKVIGLRRIKCTKVLAQPDEVTVKHNRQKVSIIIFSYNFPMHSLTEVIVDLFLDSMEWLRWILFLVKEYIGIFVFLKFELSFKRFVFSSETIFLDPWHFNFLDKFVVKTVPFGIRVDEGKVMASFWSARVNHRTS
jgi:hypothetical protein